MCQMRFEIVFVLGRQSWIMNHQKVLGVAHLRGLGEIEAAGNYCRVVDNNHLVLRKTGLVETVDINRDPRGSEFAYFGPGFLERVGIENCPDLDSPAMRRDQRRLDLRRGHLIGLNCDLPARSSNRVNDILGASTTRRKTNLPRPS